MDLSGHVLWILSVPWLFGAGVSVIASAILGIGKHKPVVPAALAGGLGNLVLSIALVKPMGVVGVAWGTAIPTIRVERWVSRFAVMCVPSGWSPQPLFCLLAFAQFCRQTVARAFVIIFLLADRNG